VWAGRWQENKPKSMTAFCADRNGVTSPYVFAGLAGMSALAPITRRRGMGSRVPRAKQVAAVVGLTGAAGLLLSSAPLYVTYRPYWVIFQLAILTGDGSEAGELASFLAQTQLLFGFHLIFQREYLPFYLWTGVTLLGVIGLLLLVMQHFRRRPRGTAAMASSPP